MAVERETPVRDAGESGAPDSRAAPPLPWSKTAPSTFPAPRGLVRRSDLEFFSRAPFIAAWARDETLCDFWNNNAQLRAHGLTTAHLGKTLHQAGMRRDAADERTVRMRRVLETGEHDMFYMIACKTRVLVNLFPLDEEDFGHKGIFLTAQETRWEPPIEADTLATPSCHYLLSELSNREFEVFHLIACGCSTAEIVRLIHRSEATVNNHIAAIHRALDTHSRADLVRVAVERGMSHFTDEEWNLIAESRARLRRGLSPQDLMQYKFKDRR